MIDYNWVWIYILDLNFKNSAQSIPFNATIITEPVTYAEFIGV
jgi:hypothetical protein